VRRWHRISHLSNVLHCGGCHEVERASQLREADRRLAERLLNEQRRTGTRLDRDCAAWYGDRQVAQNARRIYQEVMEAAR
jgi:hypothetical protein